MSVIEIIAAVMLILGALVMLVGAGGVVRFPDFFTRLHAAGKGDTLGLALALLGLALVAGTATDAFKLLVIVLLVLLLNPTATHALARSGWITGIKPWTRGESGEQAEVDAGHASDTSAGPHEEGG